MSDNYVSARLWWDGRKGAAKWRGVRVVLTAAPDLGDGAVWTLDYAPELGCRQVQRRSVDRSEAMTDEDVRAADALLVQLTKGLS